MLGNMLTGKGTPGAAKGVLRVGRKLIIWIKVFSSAPSFN